MSHYHEAEINIVQCPSDTHLHPQLKKNYSCSYWQHYLRRLEPMYKLSDLFDISYASISSVTFLIQVIRQKECNHLKKKLCTAFVLLFDKKRVYFTPHFYCLPLICTGSASNTELQRLPNVCCNLALFPLRLRMHCIFTWRQIFALQNGVVALFVA